MQVHPANSSEQSLSQYYRNVNASGGSNAALGASQSGASTSGEHVLKIYRSDQSFKYLTVHKDTSAQNVIQLALHEFGMASSSKSADFSLCEVSRHCVHLLSRARLMTNRLLQVSVSCEGVVRQRRLPDAMSGLAERISLSSRYYIKNNSSSEPLLTDSLAPELARESKVQLEELSAHTLAAQLTLQVR